MKYEVVIVGAGPAGSTAAKFLSEKGVNVLLIDKCKFPRDKPCGGGLPMRVFNRFSYIKDDLIESYSYAACAYSPSLKYNMELERNDPLIAMVLREKFDNGLVNIVKESGAKILEDKKVEDIKITKNEARIFLNDGSIIESEIVIGADGVWSTIAKKTGLRTDLKNICICLFEEYYLDKKILDNYLGENRKCHIHLSVNRTPGYGWVFPKNEHLNIGISEFKQAKINTKYKKTIKENYKTYLKILKDSNIIPNNLKIVNCKGAALPTHPLEKTYSDRVILCGDAAGFANPMTGEGIYHAMVSGQIAADIAKKALDKNDTSEKFLSRYQKIWKKEFGKDLKILYKTSKFWGRFDEKLIDAICKDKKLGEYCVDAIVGQVNARKSRKKMIRRLIYLKLFRRFIREYK